MTTADTTPTVNDLVVVQNAYTPYVPVLAPGNTSAAELTDRIRVQARGAKAAGETPGGTVNYMLIIDVSRSMSWATDGGAARRGSGRPKIEGAIDGALSALDAVPSGSRLGIIAFSDSAELLAPGFVQLTRANKSSFAASIRNLTTLNGTCMSSALQLARTQFISAGTEGQSNTVIVLTDGNDNANDVEVVEQIAPSCAALFQTEALGYGLDWDEMLLKKITQDYLRGPHVPQLVQRTEQAAEFFGALIKGAAARTITNLRLRIETKRMASLVQLLQVVPDQLDITARAQDVVVDDEDDIHAAEFPFGAFGIDESRDFLARWQVKNLNAGESRIIADVTVLYTYNGTQYQASALPLPGQNAQASNRFRPNQVAAIWTDETVKWSTVVPEVDNYTQQTKITTPLLEGAEAARRGDYATATALLQSAYDTAVAANATAQLTQITNLVTADADGKVKLRDDIDEASIKRARLQATTSTVVTLE